MSDYTITINGGANDLSINGVSLSGETYVINDGDTIVLTNGTKWAMSINGTVYSASSEITISDENIVVTKSDELAPGGQIVTIHFTRTYTPNSR